MNNKNGIYIKTKSLGELKVLSFIGEYALLEKQYDNPGKYIIACNFNLEDKSWASGLYRSSFREAFEEFNNIINSLVLSKEYRMEESKEYKQNEELGR